MSTQTATATETETTNRRQIQPGTYRARPRRWGVTKHPDTMRPAICVDFELPDGRLIAWFGALNLEIRDGAECSAWDVTQRALRAMGWIGSDIRDLRLTTAVNIGVAEETYNGKTRTKVCYVDASYIDRNPMFGAELDFLAEQIREAEARR